MDAFGLNSLLPGTASSLLAVGCVESYLALRRSLSCRALTNVLGLHPGPTIIVTSLKRNDSNIKAISYRDAYAFGHIFALCHKVNVEAQLVPFHKMSGIGDESNFFSVGGPRANRFTESEIAQFVPGFKIFSQEEAATSRESELPEGLARSAAGGFVIGDVRLPANELEEQGILIKLTPEILNQDRTVHLIFGYSGHGTGGAAYFLWRYYKRINATFKRKGYCIAVKVYRNDSYKSIEKTFTDLTAQAFARSDSQNARKQLQPSREAYNPTPAADS
jgi:hypothetical protein